MLKRLGFDEECYGFFVKMKDGWDVMELKCRNEKHAITAPLWQQVEAWLWEKHEVAIFPAVAITEEGDKKPFYWSEIGLDIEREDPEMFNSPITAKIEGIKSAVKHLHNQLKQK
jgi:hypothetical protein